MTRNDRQVPPGWQVVRLGDVAEVLDSRRIPLNADARATMVGEYPYYGANGVVDYIDRWIFDETEDLILLAEDGGHFEEFVTRPIAYRVTGRCWVNNHAHVLTAKDDVDRSFLFHSLEHKDVRPFINGSTRSKLTQTDLRGIEIDLPSTFEQRSIAAVLDSIDEAIERTEAVIAATERLRGALLHELLTRGVPGWHTEWKEAPGIGAIPACWEVVRLGDVAEVVTSGSRAWSRYFRPEGALFVRSQNISGGTIDRSDAVFVKPPADAEAVRTRIRTRDLLISITGEPGKVTMADDTLGHAHVSQHVALARLSDPGLSGFASEFLRSRAGQDQFNRAAYGQTRPGLSLMNVNNTKVAFPPPSERDMIANVGNSFKGTISGNMVGLNRLRSLKMSASDALLTGRVRAVSRL